MLAHHPPVSIPRSESRIDHSGLTLEHLYHWNDPSCGALAVAMCMLATRYSGEIKALGKGADPRSTARTFLTLSQTSRWRSEDSIMISSAVWWSCAEERCCTTRSRTSSRRSTSVPTMFPSPSQTSTLGSLSPNPLT